MAGKSRGIWVQNASYIKVLSRRQKRTFNTDMNTEFGIIRQIVVPFCCLLYEYMSLWRSLKSKRMQQYEIENPIFNRNSNHVWISCEGFSFQCGLYQATTKQSSMTLLWRKRPLLFYKDDLLYEFKNIAVMHTYEYEDWKLIKLTLHIAVLLWRDDYI